MKRSFLTLLLVLSPLFLTAVEPPEGWLTDVAAARKLAQKKNFPVLVLFSGTDWCPPCKALRRDILDTPEFQEMIAKKCVALYIHVPVRADEKFSRTMKNFPFVEIHGVPTIIVTDPGIGKILGSVHRRSVEGFSGALDDAAGKIAR